MYVTLLLSFMFRHVALCMRIFCNVTKAFDVTGCSFNIVFLFKNSRKFATTPSPAIDCTKNYQPIGVTVHLHCVESFEGLLQRFRRGRGCGEL